MGADSFNIVVSPNCKIDWKSENNVIYNSRI